MFCFQFLLIRIVSVAFSGRCSAHTRLRRCRRPIRVCMAKFNCARPSRRHWALPCTCRHRLPITDTPTLCYARTRERRHIDEKRTNTHNPKKNTNASVKMIKSRARLAFLFRCMVVHRMGPCSRMIRFVRRINFQRFDYRESSSSVAMRKLSRNLWRKDCRHVFSRSPMSMPQFHVGM